MFASRTKTEKGSEQRDVGKQDLERGHLKGRVRRVGEADCITVTTWSFPSILYPLPTFFYSLLQASYSQIP